MGKKSKQKQKTNAMESKKMPLAATIAIITAIAIIIIVAFILLNKGSETIIDTKLTEKIIPTKIATFTETGNPVCTENNKPIIRMFSTTWCPHCKWIKPYYSSVAMEYAKQGKIKAYLWEVDTGDNLLTSQVETSVPDNELAIFKQFNPNQSIPTFVFGCKYYRIGNGYERNQTTEELAQEVGEFKAVLEKLTAK